MTTHTPLRCAGSTMAALPTSSNLVLLDAGNYPGFSNFLNETWTFDGSSADWTNTSSGLVNSAGPLPGRLDAVMAYDGTNVVLYGGRGGSSLEGVFKDTWTWNGTVWAQKSPATYPFGRYKAQAAYLAGTGTVMFGGRTIQNILKETWVWNGTTWALQSPAAYPAARIDHCMAAGGGVVVLFGGSGTNSQFNDTWSYNGTTWTQASPTTKPSIRSGACMAYDTFQTKFVMFGGQNTKNYLAETWVYNGTTWTQVAIGAGPTGKINAQMAFESVTRKVILFGGYNASNGYASNETWAFDAAVNTWTQL